MQSLLNRTKDYEKKHNVTPIVAVALVHPGGSDALRGPKDESIAIDQQQAMRDCVQSLLARTKDVNAYGLLAGTNRIATAMRLV